MNRSYLHFSYAFAHCVAAALLILGALSPAFALGARPEAAAQSTVDPWEAEAGPGAILWRLGDRTGARMRWLSELEGSPRPRDAERARLAYNVGLSYASEDAPLLACAWFETALRLRPRFEAARVNRDIARADAGLGPRDRGVLGSFTGLFTRGESEWFALLGVLVFSVVALFDVLRGGAWTRTAWIALLLSPVFFLPLGAQLLGGNGGIAMVVAAKGAPLYGAPEDSADRIGRLEPGSETRVLDQLPGWVKVLDRGEERWTTEDSVVSLLP